MSISMNNIVDVTVEVSNPTAITSNFNLGLIIGTSTAISTETRYREYQYSTWQTQMITDGFKATDDEYLAVQNYFAQNHVSSSVLVGVQGASETPLQAVQACRAVNEEWYGFCFAGNTDDSKIVAVPAAVEAFSSPTVFFFQTSDENCLKSGTTNILKTLQSAKYKRTCGNYFTNKYEVCALLGVFCGLNSMQANSAYTMAFKTLVGFKPEVLDNVQFANLQSYNGNSYIQVGRTYSLYLQGVTADGTHVDEVFLLDAAQFLIQENTIAGLVSRRLIPQTEAGLNTIITFIMNGCEALAQMGVIATGIWTGDPVKDLNTGDSVPGGYVIMADTIASQPAIDREKRVTPPIYVCLKGAGAIEHVVIRVYVNR